MLTRPMLCARLDDPKELLYPQLLTPKFDGIRALTVNGRLITRNFKPVRSTYIQELLSTLPDGCDGELIVPDGSFSDVQSGVMSEDGRPAFMYCVFDTFANPLLPYTSRVRRLQSLAHPNVHTVVPYEANDVDDFLRYEEAALEAGYEGVVARDPDAPYVQGRSRAMHKWKRFLDSEARVVGFDEQHTNTNPIVQDALGRNRRPNNGYVPRPKNTLGSLLCVDVHTGVHFSIGTGFSDTLRKRVWDDQPSYLGRTLRYTYQCIGSQGRPRFPAFQCFLAE